MPANEREFMLVYQTHKAPLFRFAWRLTGSIPAAEDIVQECFLALLSGGGFDSNQGSLRMYLFGITRNLALKRVRTAECQSDEWEEAAAAFDPLADLLSMERSEIVARTVGALPPLQREALILFEYEELSLEEIAEVVGIEVGAVKARLHRAREALRRHLAPLFAERASGRTS